MSSAIKMPRALRPLLEELDTHSAEFNRLTGILADPHGTVSAAIDAGAERESCKARILGVAYRIHKLTAPHRYPKA